MDHSETGDRSTPLSEITNTIDQDPKERRNQRRRERYASLSREEKDELNRKERERRTTKKGCEDGAVHTNTETNGQLNGGRITTYGSNDVCVNDSVTPEVQEYYGTEGMHSVIWQATNNIGNQATHIPGDGQLRFVHNTNEDKYDVGEDAVTPEVRGGDDGQLRFGHNTVEDKDIVSEDAITPEVPRDGDGQLNGWRITTDGSNVVCVDDYVTPEVQEYYGTEGLHSVVWQAANNTKNQGTHSPSGLAEGDGLLRVGHNTDEDKDAVGEDAVTPEVRGVVLDPKERRNQRRRERYASLSREEKNELNRKARERRAAKNGCEDVVVDTNTGKKCQWGCK